MVRLILLRDGNPGKRSESLNSTMVRLISEILDLRTNESQKSQFHYGSIDIE